MDKDDMNGYVVANEIFLNRPTTSVLFIIGSSAFMLWYVKYLWKRRYLYYHSWNVPGPFSLPIIGSSYLFLASKTSDIMEVIINGQKKYPDTLRFWMGPKLYFSVIQPEHIEKILTSPKALDKADIYRLLSFFTGESLLTAKIPKWKKHRKVLMHGFSQKNLNNFQVIFARQGEVFAELLVKEAGNKDLDLFKYVSNCTLDIICETSCGLNMDIQNSNLDFGHNLDKIMEITNYRIFNLWHQLEFTWSWYPISKEYARVIKNFKEFTSTIVRKKLELYNDQKSRENSLEINTEKEPQKTIAILDTILDNYNFTHEELREEVDLFLLGGSDTTASTLCCIFVMLGMHQDVQQKVLEEVLDILGPNRSPVASDLPLLKYTERVIKESLRLFPVAAFFVRKIAEDIDVGDMVFPAGCSAFFGPVNIQRNPKFWPDPLKFDADRFLPENIASRHPCTYIPFSYGPRNCIGGKYAMLNMKTILAIVVRRLKIFTSYQTIEEIKLKSNLFLRLADGPKVWVETR